MARKKAATRKPAARGRSKDAAFEVEDQAAASSAASGPKAGLESGLVFVTFVALIVGLLLAQVELSGAYGKGLF